MENAGAAYVFERDQGGTGNWGQVDKLTASDAQTGDLFSAGTALDGSLILLSTHLENGGPGDPLTLAGAAYLFEVEEVVLDQMIFLPVVLRE